MENHREISHSFQISHLTPNISIDLNSHYHRTQSPAQENTCPHDDPPHDDPSHVRAKNDSSPALFRSTSRLLTPRVDIIAAAIEKIATSVTIWALRCPNIVFPWAGLHLVRERAPTRCETPKRALDEPPRMTPIPHFFYTLSTTVRPWAPRFDVCPYYSSSVGPLI